MSRRVTPAASSLPQYMKRSAFTSTPPRCGWAGDLSLKVPSGPAAAGIIQSTPFNGVKRLKEYILRNEDATTDILVKYIHQKGYYLPKRDVGKYIPETRICFRKVVIVFNQHKREIHSQTVNLGKPRYTNQWGGNRS